MEIGDISTEWERQNKHWYLHSLEANRLIKRGVNAERHLKKLINILCDRQYDNRHRINKLEKDIRKLTRNNEQLRIELLDLQTKHNQVVGYLISQMEKEKE